MSEQDDSPKKAMSFKDRIAMFNQPKAAAPAPGPPPRASKPRAFKWKTSGEGDEGGSKTVSVADVPPPAPTPTPGASSASAVPAEVTPSEQPAAHADKPVAASSGSSSGAPLETVSSTASGSSVVSAEDSIKHKGFSAEDARQTAGSLKERIALLSGLKVDKPDAPGRAPKPWRKKTQEPGEADETAKAAGEVVSPSSEQPPEQAPAIVAPAEPTSDIATTELAKDSDSTSHQQAEEAQPSQTPAIDAQPSQSASTADDKHGIALPAMPTRARGPNRKARGTAASPAVASPASEAPPARVAEGEVKPSSAEATVSVPTVAEIGSPSAGPEELGDPVPAAALEKDQVSKEPEGDPSSPGVAEEKTAEIVTGSEPAPHSPQPKRTSTNLLARAVPLPPPTAATAVEEDEDNEEEEVEEDGVGTAPAEPELATVTSPQSSLAKSSLSDPDAVSKPPAPVASPVSRPPAPPVLDTQASPRPPSISSASEIVSPTSANTNRRSMTRPPVPSGYTQESAPPSASPRSSFDNRSQRSSLAESSRASLVMSPTQPETVTAEPESMAGDGEFANPTLDSKEKEVIPPPVSKPFDTESSAVSESPKSPTRQSSMTSQQQRRASGIFAGLASPGGGSAPKRTASVASQNSIAAGNAQEDQTPETNISAMQAYRAAPEEDTSKGAAEGKEEEEEYEDPEVARRQALAKRMAAMGGMKIGMLPQLPSMMKKKKPVPKEHESSEVSESQLEQPPMSPPPPPPGVASSGDMAAAEESSSRPAPQSMPSFKPPAGAFVLPMPGRPPVPPPAVPPPPAPEEEEEEQDEPEDRDEAEDNLRTEEEQTGDDTLTPPVQEDEPVTPLPPPPPIPAARPPPLPATGQSFIETDTETEVSEKRTSMASSTGVGSLSDFPAPPAPPGSHLRTQSSASRYSSQDQPETVYEESEATEELDDRSEQTETILPPRPARPPPPLDTSGTVASGRAPSRKSSTAEPNSPAQSVRSFSQRSLPETPVSPSGHGSSQERFGALSPTTSHGSKRSSAVMSGAGGYQGPPVQPGLNNDYLAWIAVNSSKTKSRDVDGPLAHTLNDIAYTYRQDPVNFGSVVYRMYNPGVKGQVPDLDIHGRIEPGCVFFAWDAKFDRGLGRSSLKVGSAEVPHVGVVAEGVKDIKKAKVKVVELVQGRHNVETYKLDDLKSGTVEIRRLA